MKYSLKYAALSALVLSISFGSTSFAGEYEDAKSDYLKAGQAIIDMVNGHSVDVTAVEANVLSAVTAGVTLGHAYAAKHPEGKSVLDATMNKAATTNSAGKVTAIGGMGDLSFEEIEGDWHDAGYFSKNDHGLDLQDEDNEHFLDPMHTIIHPVMVLVAARNYVRTNDEGSLKAMKAEMQEGMEQVESTFNIVSH